MLNTTKSLSFALAYIPFDWMEIEASSTLVNNAYWKTVVWC